MAYDQYIGIDPSITGTSITVMNEDGSKIRTKFLTDIQKYKNPSYKFFESFIIPKSWQENQTECRFNMLTNELINYVTEYTTYFNCKVAIEGYAYSSKGLVFSIGEFVGLLKYKLRIINNIEFEIVPPATQKKFLLKGNSTKPDLFYNFSTRNIHYFDKKNPEWTDELRRFVGDEKYKFNIQKMSSPLGDIMDSIYITMYMAGIK